jgi:hypothetical protein
MKDTKTILLLVVSVLLLLVSFALLWTWGYQFSHLTKEKNGTVFILKDSTDAANNRRDSLRKAYNNTIASFNQLDSTWVKADSLKNNLDVKLTEFYKLRNEIGDLLKNPRSKADLDAAKLKIDELQRKVTALRTRNSEVEEENKKLQALIEEFRKNNLPPGNPVNPAGSTGASSKSVTSAFLNTGATATTNMLTATDMRLTAIMQLDGKEVETLEALQTDKFVGSFVVRNNSNSLANAEVYVVVIQPNGKILQNSAWDAGSFNTNEGRKLYSFRFRFDYNKGDAKRLSFSLNGDQYAKGNYTVQLYQNGSLIGRMTKTLI